MSKPKPDLSVIGGEALRDTDPNFIAECQQDPELITAFLQENTRLMDENKYLRRRIEKLENLLDTEGE
jgi:hypothetical protein